jgi:hypothetical protein
MTADSNGHNWLLFLAQLPASPSSARVALWRRLRRRSHRCLVMIARGAWSISGRDTAGAGAGGSGSWAVLTPKALVALQSRCVLKYIVR